MKKKVLFSIFLLLLIGGILYITFVFQTSTTYTLNIPDDSEIAYISIDSHVIRDKQAISTIAKVFRGKVTKIESIQDAPNGTTELFTVSIGGETFYMYKRRGRYYAEQPYNGIYRLNTDDYMLVKGFIK